MKKKKNLQPKKEQHQNYTKKKPCYKRKQNEHKELGGFLGGNGEETSGLQMNYQTNVTYSHNSS